MLKGRLGLDRARVPHRDRHGLVWLARGHLTVRDGTLQFTAAPQGELEPGVYDLPFQSISCILLGPGGTVSHDALRLMARHGTGLVAVGEGGVRCYASSMPEAPDRSRLARLQVQHWADEAARLRVARRMYEMRFDDVLPDDLSLERLRGTEAARVKQAYRNVAQLFGLSWSGRRYDRAAPEATDEINQAINHAAVALLAAAQVAVTAAGAIPQLGFIHEDSGVAFPLDIADLFREEIALQGAFGALREKRDRGGELERLVRRRTGKLIRERKAIPRMIDCIKELFHDGRGDE